MEPCRFICWEILKILGVVFTSLLATKAVTSLTATDSNKLAARLARAKMWLYASVLVVVSLGAWSLGHDIAAEVYYWAGLSDAKNFRLSKAYFNSLQAVELRPGVPRYWEALEAAKFNLGQFASVAEDYPALQRLTGRESDDVDEYRFAVCLYFLGKYDEARTVAERLIRQNSAYIPPYILEGAILTAQRKYREAQQSFAAALRILPTDQAAVEGLAHAYFLEGNRRQALRVLEATSRFSFSTEAQKRFEALRGLYGQ